MSTSKLIRASPASILHLHTKIKSRPSSFPAHLASLVQELTSKDAHDASINLTSPPVEEYNRMMKEMTSYGYGMLKRVAERTEWMGSEEVYDKDVLDLCEDVCKLVSYTSVQSNLTL